MGIRLPSMIVHVKQMLKLNYNKPHQCNSDHVPKGYIAVYIGELQIKKQFLVPISYLSHPSFQDLLNRVEEEFGFDHPMGGLTIPVGEDAFLNLASRLHASSSSH